MSRKSLPRGTRGFALLVGLAGFVVSTAGPGTAALASDPADPATTQVATTAAQNTPAAAGAAEPAASGPATAGPTADEPAEPIAVLSAAGPSSAGPSGAGPSHAGQRYAAPSGYQAVAVSVQRTRGKTNQSIFQVSGNAKQAGAVLRLASSPAFLSLRPHYVPPSKSGRYRYEVKVTYRNGKTKKVVAWSNTRGVPKVLFDVIREVETMPVPTFPTGFPFAGGFPFN